MSVVSIIEAERERYVSHFDSVVTEYASQEFEVARELLIAVDSEALNYPYRYLRADLVSKVADSAPQLFEIWLDPAQNAEARGFQLGPVAIEIYPFTWCATQIAFDRPFEDLSKLESLLTKLFEIDSQSTDPLGVANAIHSVTPLEENGQFWVFTVDFGTAPADALLDLIDFIANEALADRIIIQSHVRG